MKPSKQTSPGALVRNMFILTILVMPFVLVRSSREPAVLPRYLLLAGMLIAVVAALVVQFSRKKPGQDYRLLQRLIFPAFLLYIVFGALSLPGAIHLPEALFELSRMILFGIFFFISAWILDNDRLLLPQLCRALIIAAALLAAIAICQYFLLAFTSLLASTYMEATLTNKNLLSTALVLMLPFLIYGILHFKGFWGDFSVFSTLLSGFVIGAAHTRAAWAGLAGAAVLALGFFALLRKRIPLVSKLNSLNWKRLLYTGIIFLVIVIASAAWENYYRDHRVRQTQTEVTQFFRRSYAPMRTARIRIELWKKTLQMIGDHPWLGVGVGNWKMALNRYGTAELDSDTGKLNYVRPHNDYLWVWAESGIFGLLCYLSIFGIGFYYIYRLLFYAKDPQGGLLALLMGFGILAYLGIAFFDFPKERIVHSSLLLLMLAAATAGYHRAFPRAPGGFPKAAQPLNLLFLAILALCAVLGYSRLRSEIHVQKAFQYESRKNWPENIRQLDRAETAFYNIDPVVNPLALYRGDARLALSDTAAALQEYHEARRVHPYNILAVWKIGDIYYGKGDKRTAAEYYEKALELTPKLDALLLNLTAVYIQMKKYPEALETLNRCKPESTNPNIPRYRQLIEKQLEAEKSASDAEK